MRKGLSCALTLTLLISSTAHAQPRQDLKVSDSHNQNTDRITPEEIKEARALADRFISRFRETRDLTPLVNEMFTSNFRRIVAADSSWAGIVGQGGSLVEHLSSDERLRCFIVNFNLQYLIRLYVASKASMDSDSSSSGYALPPTLTQFLNDNPPPEGAVTTTEQARSTMLILERAMVLMQEEVSKNLPEETEQFRKNLAAFEEHLSKEIKERPTVRVYDEARHGLPAGSRLVRMVIPFHVGLIMIREAGVLKLEGAATNLPPP